MAINHNYSFITSACIAIIIILSLIVRVLKMYSLATADGTRHALYTHSSNIISITCC